MKNTRLYIRCLSQIITYLNPLVIFYGGIKKILSFYKNDNIFAASQSLNPNFEIEKQNIFLNNAKNENINFCNKIV